MLYDTIKGFLENFMLHRIYLQQQIEANPACGPSPRKKREEWNMSPTFGLFSGCSRTGVPLAYLGALMGPDISGCLEAAENILSWAACHCFKELSYSRQKEREQEIRSAIFLYIFLHGQNLLIKNLQTQV